MTEQEPKQNLPTEVVLSGRRFRSLVGENTEAGEPILGGRSIGEWLKELDLDARELSSVFDVPENTITRWDSGEMNVRYPRILALALMQLATISGRDDLLPESPALKIPKL